MLQSDAAHRQVRLPSAGARLGTKFRGTRLSPGAPASSRVWLDAIAKYTEHKTKFCAMGVFRSQSPRARILDLFYEFMPAISFLLLRLSSLFPFFPFLPSPVSCQTGEGNSGSLGNNRFSRCHLVRVLPERVILIVCRFKFGFFQRDPAEVPDAV